MKIRNKYVVILLSVVFSFFICGNSFARETWENKALAEGVWNCYYALSNKLDYIITDRVVMDDVDSINNIIANNNENFVPLIYGKFKIDDAGLSCRQLFAGYKGATQSFEGLLGTLSKSTVLTTNERKTILEKMGYKANKDANTGGKCFVLKYRYFEKDINGNIKNDSNKETQQICIPSSSSKVTDIVVSGEKGNIFFNKTNKKITLKIPKDVLDSTYSVFDTNTEDAFVLADYNSLDELRQAIVNAASARFKAGYDGSTAIRWSKNDNGWYVDFDSRDPVRTFNYNESSGIEYTFGGYSDNNTLRLDGRKDASVAAISNLVGVGIKYYDDLKFSSLERVGLYKYYIKDYYKADYDCNWAESQNATKEAVEAQGYTIIEPENGSGSCIIKATDHKSDTVNGLNKDMHFSDTKYSLKDIAVVLNNESNIDIEEELEKPSSTDIDSGEYTGSGSTEPCWNSGIDSMAWVMCPVESNLKDFAKGMGQYIDKWLQVDSELYKNGSSTQIAWGYVRTIANTLMIIFMAVIIFSQLTGYGIDNYGIKKLLPKFIVMALLINLSFFVCQVVVDLSNIIGNGIQSLFYSIGNSIIEQSSSGAQNVLETNFIEAATKAVYAVVVAGPGVIGAGLTIYSAYSGGGAILAVVLVLLMLLTIVAAVLMFFVSLGARMVIIIMCMILAPLALVCYILPNTKPVYKKWFDAFKAAVIIYPICGFTIGVSYIVKAIVLTQSNPPLFMVVVSGIVPYLPFFMIPTMLKSAIGAIGTVGAALGSLGSSFKSGAGKLQNTTSNMIKNSDRYKNAERLTSEKRMNWKAGFDPKTGHLTERGKRKAKNANKPLGRFFGNDRLQAAYIAAAEKNQKTDQEATAALTGAVADVEISGAAAAAGFGAATREAYYANKYLEAAKANDVNAMKSAIVAMNQSGMKQKDIAKTLRYAENNGYHTGLDSTTKASYMRDIANDKDNRGWLSTDFEFSHFASSGGGFGGRVDLGDYGEYAKTADPNDPKKQIIEKSDFKPEDGGSLSGDSLAGMAAAGIIDQSMAQSILANNPNLSADKKVMLSAVATGKANIKDAAQFKAEANAVLGGNGMQPGGTIAGMSVDDKTVQAWTSARPKEVNVVQNFKAGGQQYDDLRVTEGQTFQVQGVGSARAQSQYPEQKTQFRPHDPNKPW